MEAIKTSNFSPIFIQSQKSETSQLKSLNKEISGNGLKKNKELNATFYSTTTTYDSEIAKFRENIGYVCEKTAVYNTVNLNTLENINVVIKKSFENTTIKNKDIYKRNYIFNLDLLLREEEKKVIDVFVERRKNLIKLANNITYLFFLLVVSILLFLKADVLMFVYATISFGLIPITFEFLKKYYESRGL